jgi:hypothetical protein
MVFTIMLRGFLNMFPSTNSGQLVWQFKGQVSQVIKKITPMGLEAAML